MKRLSFSLVGAALAILVLVATVAAASPAPSRAQDQVQARDTIPTVLGLARAQVMDLRHEGLSLAQIAERQKVDVQKLIDTLVAQWSTRIDARVANGGLTEADAGTLRAELAGRAGDLVNQTTLGGMRGAAVGGGRAAASAGAGSGAGVRAGSGAAVGARGGGASRGGACDGTGPHGNAAP